MHMAHKVPPTGTIFHALGVSTGGSKGATCITFGLTTDGRLVTTRSLGRPKFLLMSTTSSPARLLTCAHGACLQAYEGLQTAKQLMNVSRRVGVEGYQVCGSNMHKTASWSK